MNLCLHCRCVITCSFQKPQFCVAFVLRITTLGQCHIGAVKAPISRKHVILLGIPSIYPWSNIWEYISYFIQLFLFLILLCYSCNGIYFMTNAFEKISVTITNPEGCPIDIIRYSAFGNSTTLM